MFLFIAIDTRLKKLRVLFLMGVIPILISCEKVIEVELDEADQQLVVEASLKEGKQMFRVWVTYTAPYFESVTPQVVSDARVILKDNTGESFIIPFGQDGAYEKELTGVAGRTYTLQVDYQGTIHTAQSYLPEVVPLIDLYSEFQKASGPQEEGYTVYLRYQDPAGVANYYRARYAIGGVLHNRGEDLQVFTDNHNDGNIVRVPLYGKIFALGDTVTVEHIHFDEASYDYFNSLADIVNNGSGPNSGSAAPGNPNSNWSGGILGYFSACSSDSLTLIISE